MALIKWRGSYSVEVEQFDKEHMKLIELINQMFVIVRDNKKNTALLEVIEKLVEYTVYHFNAEEAAMQRVNYPMLEEHKSEHARLVHQVMDFQERIKNEEDGVRTGFYHFLRDWLLDHIIESDKKYSKYINE